MTEAEENLFLLVAQFSHRDRCPRYIVQAVEAVLEERAEEEQKEFTLTPPEWIDSVAWMDRNDRS
jgi:hypothetical protein